MKQSDASGGSGWGTNRPGWFLLAGGFCLSAIPGMGQDALRLVAEGQQLYADLQRDAEQVTQRQEGNVRWGPADVVFGLSLGFGYNDNINLTPDDREDSFIIAPAGSAKVFWDATESGSLALSVGVGYSKYIDHSENDQFTISPNSSIAYTMFVGGVRLRFQNNISYSVNPVDVAGVSGVSQYGGLQNTFSIVSDWEFRKAVLSVGYNHYNFISTRDASDAQQNTMDSVFARMPFELNPAFSIGPEASWGYTRFKEDLRNDNHNVSVGGYAQWDPTDRLSFQARLGYAYYFFQGTADQPPPGDTGSVYGTLAVSQIITEVISHSLSFSHSIQSGYQSANADATELTQLNYQIGFSVIRDVSLSLGCGYTHGTDIGGVAPEIYDQFIVSAGTGYQLTKKLNIGLTYQFAAKSSDIPGNDYSQNSVWLSFGYTF